MHNNKKNEELQTRREFFKKAAKGALPILGAIVLANTPFKSFAHESQEELGCDFGCYGGCAGGCGRSCSVGCSGSCSGSCSGACKGSCGRSCSYGSGGW